MLMVASATQAATITVTIADDISATDGLCSLREAITDANNNANGGVGCSASGDYGDDTIVLSGGLYGPSLPVTIGLSSELLISDSVTIQGPYPDSPAHLTIDGQNSIKPFSVYGATGCTLTLENLTVTNGTSANAGGAIVVNSPSNLTLDHVIISNNSTTNLTGGGAIDFSGDAGSYLRILNSIVTNNTAPTGGAVRADNSANLIIYSSEFTTNSATYAAGALDLASAGDIIINDSRFIGNSADYSGGAIRLSAIDSSKRFSLYNSTFADNTLQQNTPNNPFGGALNILGAYELEWGNVTFSSNTINRSSSGTAGGSAFSATSATGIITNITVAGNSVTNASTSTGYAVAIPTTGLTVRNSVIADNSPINCKTAIDAADDGGYNLESGTDCGFITGIQSTDPMLKPLADNGGPVQTMAPSFGSPLIDGGNPSGCLDYWGMALLTDARGSTRVDGDDLDTTVSCDIGAYEFGGIGAVAILVNTAMGGDPSGSVVEKSGEYAYYKLMRYGNLQPFSTVVQSHDGDAVADLDYLAVTNNFSWTTGNAGPAPNAVALIADSNPEPHESFTAALSSGLPGVDVSDPLTVTIREPVFSLATASATKAEGADTHTITVNLDGTYTTDVGVYVTLGGSAARDADYSFSNVLTIPAGQTSANFTLQIINDHYDEGDETVTITLDAPNNFGTLGAITTHTLTITDDDTTPVGDYTPKPAAVDEDPAAPLTITLSATDADGDTAFNYAITAQPAHGQLGGSGVDRSYTPGANYSGSDSFTFTVDDTYGNTSGEVTVAITVNPVADAPVITSGATVDVVENQSAVTTVTASDDDGDAVTFTLSGGADATLFDITSGGALTFKSAPSFEAKLDANGDGIYLVEVTATDASASYLTGAQTLAITVTNVNEAPVGTVAIDGIAEEDQTLSANTSGLSDDDGLGTLHYQWRSGGANVGSDSASYTLGDSDVGNTVSVTVSYTDNGGTLEGVSSGATPAVANINDAPTLSGTPATSVLEGAAYSFTPTAGDADAGDTLTFSVSNNPAWLTINLDSGLLSGTPERGDIGTTSGIIVSVSDAATETSLPPFDLTVEGDLDRDGISDTADTDDDGDGVPDSEDALPLDATESVDTDGDGIGNNADTDDDGDGVADSEDDFPLDASQSVAATSGGGGGGGAMVWFPLVALPLLWRRRKSDLAA
jgi:CSLREA domain-containing protein